MSLKIATVIAVRNLDKYLSKAVESVLIQHYADTEIVIVSDGSSDRTAEIALDYQLKYPNKIKAVILEENKGTFYARRLGVEACSEDVDLIVFLDGDDCFVPVAFDRLIKQWSLTQPDYLIFSVFFEMFRDVRPNILQIMLPHGVEDHRTEVFYRDNVLEKFIEFQSFTYCSAGKVFKRELLLEVFQYIGEMPSGYYYSEDTLINTTYLLFSQKIGFHLYPLYYYCQWEKRKPIDREMSIYQHGITYDKLKRELASQRYNAIQKVFLEVIISEMDYHIKVSQAATDEERKSIYSAFLSDKREFFRKYLYVKYSPQVARVKYCKFIIRETIRTMFFWCKNWFS